MENKLLEELAKEIAQSKRKYEIIKEFEWWLEGHYTKCRFLAVVFIDVPYKPEYYKLAEKLQDRELLLKLYKMILEFIRNKS